MIQTCDNCAHNVGYSNVAIATRGTGEHSAGISGGISEIKSKARARSQNV